MRQGPTEQVYRARRRIRLAISAMTALFAIFWLGFVAFLVLRIGPIFAEIPELLGEDTGLYLRWAITALVVSTALVAAEMVYVARYWWTYRVVLDEQAISRQGLPNPLSPRFSVRFQDIEQVAVGSPYTLRIIPRTGKVGVLNLRVVEDGIPGLVGELRSRLMPGQVQTDLESAVTTRQRRGNLELVAAVGGGLVLLSLFLSMAFGRPIKSLFGWNPLIGWNTKVFAIALAPDTAVWTLQDGDLKPGFLGIRLHRSGGGEGLDVDLPDAPEALVADREFGPLRNPVRGMAVDDQNRAWFLTRERGRILRWDGEAWKSFEIPNLGVHPEITEIVRLNGQTWGYSRVSRLGFSIDWLTDETSAFYFIDPREDSDSALHLNPTDMQVTANGGLVITGVSQEGFPGLIHVTSAREIDVMTLLHDQLDLPDSTWSLSYGSADAEDNLYAIFTSPSSCADSTYEIRLGIFDRSIQEWRTKRLLRSLDCSGYWSLPSFAVDPRGRIWMAVDAQVDGGVAVYESAPHLPGGQAGIQPIRLYTEANSNFSGEPIAADYSGFIYALDDLGGRAVWINGYDVELPDPAPRFLTLVWQRPYYFYGPYMALVLFLSIRAARRDRRREYPSSRGATDEATVMATVDHRPVIVFRQTARYRRAPVLVAVFFPSLLLAALITMPLLAGESLSDLAYWLDWPLGLIMLLMPLVFGAAIGYWALFAWKDRLVLTESHFERQGLHHFRIYRGPVRFDEIVSVRLGAPGVIVIEKAAGRKFEFAPKAYAGGPGELLGELRRRIPADRFEPELEQRLDRRTKGWWRALLFYAAGALLYLLGMFYDDIVDRVREDLVWRTEVKAESLRESIEDMALQEDGSIWLLVRKPLGDFDDPRNYEVRHLSSSGTETLGFPALEVLYPDRLPENGGRHPEGIAVSKDGVPRVFMFLVDAPLVWSGTRWAWEGDPMQRSNLSYLDVLLQGPDAQYWQAVVSGGKIEAFNPTSGAAEVIDLGADIEKYAFVYGAEPRGWTIVRYRSLDRRFFLLPFIDSPAGAHWVEVDVSGLDLEEFWDLPDYTLGPTGALYALISEEVYCENDLITLYVGKLEPDAGTAWVWRTLQYPQDCDDPGDPRELVVDAKSRVLIQGWNRVAIFDSAVFDNPEFMQEDLVVYTDRDSGFYMSHSLEIGPDERVWSLDMTGDALVSFDPHMESLPKPLPPWVGVLSSSFWTPFGFMIAGAAFYAVGVILTRNYGRLRRQKPKN